MERVLFYRRYLLRCVGCLLVLFFVRVCVIMEIQFYQFRPLFLDGFPTPHPYPSRPFPLVCVRVAIVFFNISTTVPIVFCFLFFSAAAFCSSSLLKFRLTNHVGERASTKQNKTHTTKTKRASKDEHEVRVCVCVAVLCPSPAPRPPRPPPHPVITRCISFRMESYARVSSLKPRQFRS